jgi:hypothetical protein
VDLALQGHINTLEQAKHGPTTNIAFREKIRLALTDMEFEPDPWPQAQAGAVYSFFNSDAKQDLAYNQAFGNIFGRPW